jgi:hypothetical protein
MNLGSAFDRQCSIAAEVISLLKDTVPTAAELKRRKRLYEELMQLQSSVPPGRGPFPTTEEMVREDRER